MKKLCVLIIAVCLVLICSPTLAEYTGYISHNPADLAPIAGTVWKFVYDYNGVEQHKLIGFSEDVQITSDGEAALLATDLEWIGLALYGDYIGIDGRGFLCTLMDESFNGEYRLYMFSVYSDIAIGSFLYYNKQYPSSTKTSLLMGSKFTDLKEDQDEIIPQADQNQPISELPMDELPDNGQIEDPQQIQQDQNQPIIDISITKPIEAVGTQTDPIKQDESTNQQTKILEDQQDQEQKYDTGKPKQNLSDDDDKNKFGCFILSCQSHLHF